MKQISLFAALLAALLLLGACDPSQRYERDVGASSAPTSLALAAPAPVPSATRRLPAGMAGMPMMYEIKPEAQANLVLARLIEESLHRDPSGNSPIRGGPCTTPRMFAEAISAYHPQSMSPDAVGQLPDYIRSLIRRSAPDGLHTMSRVLVGRGCVLDLEGWARIFAPGEGAWHDPNTGLPVLAGDCSNVVAPNRRPATPPVPAPAPVAPQPTEVACVPLPPEALRKVVFVSQWDAAAWKACNPQASCDKDCRDYLEGNRGTADDRMDASAIRALIGEGGVPLIGTTHAPVVRADVAVFCQRGTRRFWRLLRTGIFLRNLWGQTRETFRV